MGENIFTPTMTRNYNAAEDKGGLKQLFSSLKLFRNRSLKKGKGNDSASKIKSTNDTFKVSGVLFSAASQFKMRRKVIILCLCNYY